VVLCRHAASEPAAEATADRVIDEPIRRIVRYNGAIRHDDERVKERGQ
jgi:hypothetical protein